MSLSSPKPANVTWVSPHIIVKDIEAILPFYQNAFGFEILEAAKGPEGTISHAELRYKDQMLMLGKSGAYGGTTQSPKETGIESPMNLYLYCEDVDKFYQQALAAGAKSVTAPEAMFWGDKMCRLLDPEGYLWCFATYSGQRDNH
jgi:PhnB protein